MPQITVGETTVEVPADLRLTSAVQQAGVEIGHRCGGFARCTTCRVTFQAGEPTDMTQAEFDKLTERGLIGEYRLSCQILCTHDMAVTPAMTKQSESWSDTGPEIQPVVSPEAAWFPIEALKRN
jgi:ferredoxin